MIVYLHGLVDVRELLALHGGIVGGIEEPVALPGCSGELGPLNVVAGQLARLQVDDVELLPVAARARDGIGGILAVV